MIPCISNKILGKFNLNYKRHISPNQQLHCKRNMKQDLLSKTVPLHNLGDDIVLRNYCRSYVSIKVLELLNSDVTSTLLQFTRKNWVDRHNSYQYHY